MKCEKLVGSRCFQEESLLVKNKTTSRAKNFIPFSINRTLFYQAPIKFLQHSDKQKIGVSHLHAGTAAIGNIQPATTWSPTGEKAFRVLQVAPEGTSSLV
jgi:hypothetical protein